MRATAIVLVSLAALAALAAAAAAQPPSATIAEVRAAQSRFKQAVVTAVRRDAAANSLTLAANRMLSVSTPKAGAIVTGPAQAGSFVLFSSEPDESGRLPAGLYQLQRIGARVRVVRFDPSAGRVLIDIQPPSGDPAMFHTPLGDDLCGDAEGGLADYCQTLVACWAYDLFC